MPMLILPFGSRGWDEKTRILKDILSVRAQPPYVYNDVLVLVPSSRLKRIYGRILLDMMASRGSAALVPPEIQTMHQFLHRQYQRLNAPRLIDENSRLVLLEGLVKEALAENRLFQNPDLIAPSLSSALASMVEQLRGAGVSPDGLAGKVQETEFSDKPQVRLLTAVYRRYEQALRDLDLSDPARLHSLLLDRFDPAWLAPYRRIVIDGIRNTNRLETALLKKLADCRDCTVIAESPSADLLASAGEDHPLAMVRELAAALAAGPGQEKANVSPDDRYLAAALFSDKPFSETARDAPASFSKRVALLSAVNAREEVTLIAGQVKDSIRAGTHPDTILVTFPALDDYASLVEEVFTDNGIPFNRALGRQLSSSPVTTAVISLLRSLQEDYSGPSLLRVLSSPFLKFGGDQDLAAALDRFLREQKIAGRGERILSALRIGGRLESGQDILSAALNDLFAALAPFSRPGPAPLADWMERLSALIAWSEMSSRVALIKGALNINLQAYKKIEDAVASLYQAGSTFPDYRCTFDEWLFLLKKTFMHTRFQVPPDDEGGVQILGLEESVSLPWNEIYLGGLVDGRFPQRLPQNIFLPERVLESLGVRILERSRLNASYQFYRLLLSSDRVTLTWPENDGDRPVIPSPFLAELAPLQQAGLLNRGKDRISGIQFSMRIEDSSGISELAKAVALQTGRTGLETLLQADAAGMDALRKALDYRRSEAPQAALPVRRMQFSVTELDAYLTCPYDYYISGILRIKPLEETSEDLSAQDRGSKVHAILRNFYLSWKTPVTRENVSDAMELLRKLTDSAFAAAADTFRNRREKNRFLSLMAGRFLDAEIGFWNQGMRPVYIERKIDRYPLVLSDGRHVELTGKIDRIDADEAGNFIIVDYKTGKYPQPVTGIEQKIFQLPLYAVMAREALSKSAGGSEAAPLGRAAGLAYYDLAGKTGPGARDTVLFDRGIRSDHPSTKPKAASKSPEEFEAILKQSLEKARTAVEHILAGAFPQTPQDESRCRFCANEILCERAEIPE